MKLSVIIPAYNVEEYIDECVQSVLKQLRKDIEVIIINDGSTDQTKEKLLKYLDFENVNIIHQENQGLSITRNRGIELAKGEYLHFLDADDFVSEKAYNILNDEKILIEKPDMIVFDGCNYNHETKSIIKNYGYTRKKQYPMSTGREFLRSSMKNGEYYSSACLYMSKKDFIKKNKLMFMPHILHEDELFTMESLLIAKKTIHFKNEIYIRRIRNNSIMSSDKNLILKINSLLVIIEKMRILKELYFKKSNSFIYNRIRRLSHNILSLICKGNLSDSKEILLKKELILKTTRARLYFSNPKLYCLMFRKYDKIVIRLRKVLGKS